MFKRLIESYYQFKSRLTTGLIFKIVNGSDVAVVSVNAEGTLEYSGIKSLIVDVTASIFTCSGIYNCLKLDASSNTLQIELLEPNSDNNGQEYKLRVKDATNVITLLAFSKTLLDVDTITNTAGNIWRYTMNGSPDLSGVIAGQYVKTANSTNSANNGIWVITSVDDSSDHIELENVSGVVELTDSSSTLQLEVLNDTSLLVDETRLYKANSIENKYERWD